MSETDLKGPLSQFQCVDTHKAGMLNLMLSLNRALLDEDRMPDERARRVFETWWPELEASLSEIPSIISAEPKRTVRGDRELLEEVLQITRRLAGVGEFKPPPSISEMIATLQQTAEMLDRKESSLSTAEYGIERAGHEVPDSLKISLAETEREIERYANAIKALKDIESPSA
jgi:hypothetical protein